MSVNFFKNKTILVTGGAVKTFSLLYWNLQINIPEEQRL
jgi:hypothetical protein